MAEDKHSFQNILKLMSAMQAFETLLVASSLTADTSVTLGINAQLKALRETLTQYISHENTSVENLRCVCDLCDDEVKIFDFDLKTSMEIHCRSELHKIMAKNKEMNQHSQDPKLKLKMEPPFQLEDLNNIPNELKKVSLNDVSSFKEKDCSPKQNNLSGKSKQIICSCERAFCICDLKDENPIFLEGKLSNINLIKKTENLENSPLPIPSLFSGPFNVPPPLFPMPRQYIKGMVNAQQLPEQLPLSQKLTHGSEKPIHNQTRKKMKQVEIQSAANHPVGIPTSKQQISIHVHMGANSATSLLTDEATKQAPNETQNETLFTEENFQKLLSRELNHRAEFHLIYRMVREVEGCYWSKGNFTKNGNEFSCNVCSLMMNSSYDFINHVRGTQHLETLRKSSINVNQPRAQNRNQNKINHNNNKKPVAHNETKPVFQETVQPEKKQVDERAQLAQMWRFVKQAEGDRWSNQHIIKYDYNNYHCNICDVTLNSPFQLMQHVQGSAHQRGLDDEAEYEVVPEDEQRSRTRRNQSKQKDDCIVM